MLKTNPIPQILNDASSENENELSIVNKDETSTDDPSYYVLKLLIYFFEVVPSSTVIIVEISHMNITINNLSLKCRLRLSSESSLIAKNCTFDPYDKKCESAVEIFAKSNSKFINCTFTKYPKIGIVINDNSKVKFRYCKFEGNSNGSLMVLNESGTNIKFCEFQPTGGFSIYLYQKSLANIAKSDFPCICKFIYISTRSHAKINKLNLHSHIQIFISQLMNSLIFTSPIFYILNRFNYRSQVFSGLIYDGEVNCRKLIDQNQFFSFDKTIEEKQNEEEDDLDDLLFDVFDDLSNKQYKEKIDQMRQIFCKAIKKKFILRVKKNAYDILNDIRSISNQYLYNPKNLLKIVFLFNHHLYSSSKRVFFEHFGNSEEDFQNQLEFLVNQIFNQDDFMVHKPESINRIDTNLLVDLLFNILSLALYYALNYEQINNEINMSRDPFYNVTNYIDLQDTEIMDKINKKFSKYKMKIQEAS